MVELGNLRKNRNIKIMCGRYVLYSKEKFKNKYNIDIIPNYNISPNQEVFVIDQNINITKLKWGIRAEWKNSLIINARSETIDVKKSFSNLNRCVFISDGYYEWKQSGKLKTPYFHYIPNSFLYFAGLCNNKGCVVVTMDSFHYLSKVHRRQPFFLKENHELTVDIIWSTDFPNWIKETILWFYLTMSTKSMPMFINFLTMRFIIILSNLA